MNVLASESIQKLILTHPPFTHRTGPETQLFSCSHYRRHFHDDGNTFPAVHGLELPPANQTKVTRGQGMNMPFVSILTRAQSLDTLDKRLRK
ncbi:hypothetical protein D9611_006654 [Ephemerocybe angulata]|uniref:Uncharacterized protein n=1 Tax=Ephemerocybe angulata TaxID=980116 RepID=A0A8H5C7F7_9AGAR|nr:hypothetical protein D9611_006654 [Tulosesus angulatus]